MLHPCEIIYHLSNKPIFGKVEGVCKITGKQAQGLEFSTWVRDTFTDLGNLKPGTIISNEAAFCFSENNTYIQNLVAKEKPQNFRTYSHFVQNGKWAILHKGQKQEMYDLLIQNPQIVCISESGQKHLLFKHRIGFWQFEETFIYPNLQKLKQILSLIHQFAETFTNEEILTGKYNQFRILKIGIAQWQKVEKQLEIHRGTAMFNFALFFSKIKNINT